MKLITVVQGPSLQEAKEQLERSKASDLVEIRFDLLHFDWKLLNLKRKIPLIFTLRASSQGGKFKGNECQRKRDLEALMHLKPDFIDLEYFVENSFIETLRKISPSTKIIISFHDFEKTPDNIKELFFELQKKGGDYYKISTFANSTLDAFKTLKLIKNSPPNLLLISMGKYGVITRILNRYGYCCINENKTTAIGQLTLESLEELYRVKSIDAETSLFGLIGEPIDESLSPAFHNLSLKKFNINGCYIKMPLQKEELKAFFESIKEFNFKGLSVTMPLKEAVLEFLDEIETEASAISAVNTILIKDGKLKGFNTDGEGALLAIQNKMNIKGKKILILGTGGSARAIAYVTKREGAAVTLMSRSEAKALRVAEEVGCHGEAIDKISLYFNQGVDLLINCTPKEEPFDLSLLPEKICVMEIKTFPVKSKLILEAKKKECLPIFGHEMFNYQALLQFQIFIEKGSSEPS